MKLLTQTRFRLASIIAVIVVVGVNILFANKKQGFYIDEYYVYTVANGTQYGIDITPGEWNDTSDYYHQLVSEGVENFRFRQVYENESANVHPPLYYYLIHFVSSLFPGVFSKWIGLSLNLAILIPTLIIVYKLAWEFSGQNKVVTLITVVFFGINPATISMVVLTRMYLLLSLWTLAYAYIHVINIKRERLSISHFLVPVFATGFLGFLTQYFFVVVMFFITLTYALFLTFFRRHIKAAIAYGFTALFSLISTYLVWPFSYFHIFKGYRGQGAMSQARDVAGMYTRIFKHLQYLNRIVFSGTIIIFIPLLVVGVILVLRRLLRVKNIEKKNVGVEISECTTGYILIIVSALLSFFALAIVALSDGVESCRQLYHVYALFLVLIPAGIYRIAVRFTGNRIIGSAVITAITVSVVVLLGYIHGSVLFLYEDEKIAMDYARNHTDEKVVMFQKDDGNYDSRIQELILHPQVYYVSVGDLTTAIDPVIASADELFVYVPTGVDEDECFDCIYKQNPKIKRAKHMWNYYAFFKAYHLQ